MKKLCVLSIIVATLVLAIPAHAQALHMEWQSPAGANPIAGFAPLKPAEFTGRPKLDANGDGTADLAMFDKVMHPARLLIVSGADRSTQWTYPFPSGFEIDGKGNDLIMAEIVGDGGLKEAVVARRQGNRLIGVLEGGKVRVEDGVVLFGQQYVLLGIADYDDDGDIELYLGETEKRVVEVWGSED